MSLNDELREDPYYLQSYQTQLLAHQNEHLEDMEAPSFPYQQSTSTYQPPTLPQNSTIPIIPVRNSQVLNQRRLTKKQ